MTVLYMTREAPTQREVDTYFVDTGVTTCCGHPRVTQSKGLDTDVVYNRTLRCSVDVDALRALDRE